MLLSFSTLGCPKWPLDTVVSRAAEYGYDAVDFRGLQGQMEIFNLPEFTTGLARTKDLFAKAGIVVSGFSTSVRLIPDAKQTRESNLAELRAYCELGERLGVRLIRVFEGGGDLSDDAAVAPAAAALREMAKIACDHGAAVLLETHSPHVSGLHCQRVMEAADVPGAGILWDTFNPWQAIDEQLEATWAAVGRWVRNTHWKDAKPDAAAPGGHKYCPFGLGTFPASKLLGVLRAGGYSGPLTLEWEKMWHPDIEEPEVAFPAFAKAMRAIM